MKKLAVVFIVGVAAFAAIVAVLYGTNSSVKGYVDNLAGNNGQPQILNQEVSNNSQTSVVEDIKKCDPACRVQRVLEEKKPEMHFINSAKDVLIYAINPKPAYCCGNTTDKVADKYDWFLFDGETGNTKEITGIKFQVPDGPSVTVEKVWGWDDDDTIVVGDDLIVALGHGAKYDVKTAKVTPMSYMDFELWMLELGESKEGDDL